MDDLIYREAALKAMDGEITITGRGNAGRVYMAIKQVADRIKALPAAEQKTGKWISDNDNWQHEPRFMCSACGESDRVPTIMGEPIWRFCPWCGARMENCDDND